MAERSPQELDQTPVQEARQKLKDECEQLWLKVQKLQEKVKEVRNPVKVETDNIALSVRNHKVKALKAQIESRRQHVPEGLPTDRPVLEALLLDDLEKTTHQMKQLSTIVSSQNEELRGKIDREKRWLQEQKDVNEALRQKIDALGDGAGGNITKQSLLKKLDKERQTVVKYNTKRMKQLKEFIEKHITEPTEETVSKWSKQRGRRSVETVPMIIVLEELINRSISTPHEPYITVTESHWPQFTEFLLRFSIAQKHPEDDSKLRVTPFHL